jgi:hypothetical protein
VIPNNFIALANDGDLTSAALLKEKVDLRVIVVQPPIHVGIRVLLVAALDGVEAKVSGDSHFDRVVEPDHRDPAVEVFANPVVQLGVQQNFEGTVCPRL